MKQPLLKTQAQQSEFIQRFAKVVEENSLLRNKCKVKFHYLRSGTQFTISDNTGRPIDITGLLSKKEYAKYIALLYWWQRG